MGLGGKQESAAGTLGTFLTATDYKTGKIVWRHQYPEAGAWGGTNVGHPLLSTAGKLLLGGNPGGNIVAYEPAKGTPLWHAHIGDPSNGPETYMLDGKQYLLIAAVDMLYAFTLN